MKRLFLLSFIFLQSISTAIADSGTDGGNLPLIIKTTNPGENHQPFSKSPVQIPIVYLNGSILFFDSSIEGCTIQLLDEDENVIFSHFIEENETSLVLPMKTRTETTA